MSIEKLVDYLLLAGKPVLHADFDKMLDKRIKEFDQQLRQNLLDVAKFTSLEYGPHKYIHSPENKKLKRKIFDLATKDCQEYPRKRLTQLVVNAIKEVQNGLF